GMPVDDEVPRGADLVVTAPRLEERSIREIREAFDEDSPCGLVVFLVDPADRRIGVVARAAPRTHPEATAVVTQGRPSRYAGEVVARAVGRREPLVPRRCAEIVDVP